jgi:GGDEF domain-containing protein
VTLIPGALAELGDHGKSVRITISAGRASYPEDGADAAELFATPDGRMFEAKHAGRNCVVTCTEVAVA